MRWAVACILMGFLLGGCDKSPGSRSSGEERTYKGKTESDWIRQSKDAEWFTRLSAFDALAKLGRADVLDSAARGEGNPEYRCIIGERMFLCSAASKEDRRKALGHMLDHLERKRDGIVYFGTLREMVKSHPDECRPLLPLLKRYKEAGSLANWQELIDLIERE